MVYSNLFEVSIWIKGNPDQNKNIQLLDIQIFNNTFIKYEKLKKGRKK